MGKRLLFVDDEASILSAIEKMLFKKRKIWTMEFASGGQAGLEKIGQQTYDLVMADMRMPGMDGVEFLTQVKDKSPDTVRMMLTGNTDLDTAVKAINGGCVFRFLTKPCDPKTLIETLENGLEQRQLITAEKELLSQTLSGSIRLLTELLQSSDNSAFAHTEEVRDTMRRVAKHLRLNNTWELMVGAMLAPIGYITLPPELLAKVDTGASLSTLEQEKIDAVPEIGYKLLKRIPRLDRVAQTVRYQNKHFDGGGLPQGAIIGNDIPLGARLLKILQDAIVGTAEGTPHFKVLQNMKKKLGVYDPQLLEQILPVFTHLTTPGANGKVAVELTQLHLGQKLLSNVETENGRIIVPAGSRISPMFLEKINAYIGIEKIKEPIYVDQI